MAKQSVIGASSSGTIAVDGLLFNTVVDAAGNGTHTTLTAAIAATPAYGSIAVISDLTILAPILLTKTGIKIHFFSGATVYNDATTGTGDAFASDIAVGVVGERFHCELINPIISRSLPDRAAGAAINFHSAFAWRIVKPLIDNHAVGLRFDASPYPSGQGSHSSVYDPNISNCGVGIYNTGSANINQVYSPHLYGNDLHVWHESGLNLNIFGARIENLGPPVATEQVKVDAPRLFMPALHLEGNMSTSPIKVNSGGSAFIYGDVYVYGGGGPALCTIDANAGPCDINLSNAGRTIRSRVQPETAVRTTGNDESVGFITEYRSKDTATGPEVTRAGFRSDGILRLVPRTTDPATGTLATGDLMTFTTAAGAATVAKIRDGSSWRGLARLDLTPAQTKLADVSVLGTIKTVYRSLTAETITGLTLNNDGFVAYTATDYWTVTFEEWNGNTKVGDIATYTQTAQIGHTAVGPSNPNYALAAGRIVKVKFTATGAPPAWTSPLVQLVRAYA